MIQLDPTMPLDTPKGPGHAHFLIDPGQEHHLQWVVFLDKTGECWTFKNPEVRLQTNATMGIRTKEERPNPCGGGCDAGSESSPAGNVERSLRTRMG